MRLWHQSIIPKLPRQQLLGQHRECCALRGAGWGRKHATVDYVFTYSPEKLVAYHLLIMEEMEKRGYKPNSIWKNPNWRGNKLGEDNWIIGTNYTKLVDINKIIYPEHNNEYLKECINNLKSKGIDIKI